MANVGTLLMNVDANTKKFESGMKRSQKAMKSFTKVVKVGAVATAAALSGIAVKSIKLAQEQEQAEARLESIAKKVTGATDDQVKALKDLAAAQQKVSTFGDEVLITGQSQLLSFGLQAEQAGDLTESLANMLAATKGINATQEDAINAANMLGKAFDGQAGALSRAGILLNDTQADILKNGTAAEKTAALVEIMNQNYGGLAETLAQTTAGQMQQAKNAIGDIGEKLGDKLLPILNNVLSWVQSNMPAIENFFSTTFDVIGKVISGVSEFVKTNLIPIFKMLFEWIQSNMPSIQGTFETVFGIVKEVMNGVWMFVQDNLLPIFTKLFDWVQENMPLFETVFKNAFEVAKKVGEDLMITIGDVWDVMMMMWDIVKPILEKIGPAFVSSFGIITGAVLSGINRLTEFLQAFLDVESKLRKQDPLKGWAADVAGNVSKFFGIDENTIRNFKTNIGVSGQNANGGPVMGGSSYLVGEKGPEIFTPATGGMITPNGGGGNVTININGSQDPDLIMTRVVQELNRQGITGR